MSAFTVNDKTIKALVGYYAFMRGGGSDSCERLDEISQLLWDENYKSVNYRYRESNTAPPIKYDSSYAYGKNRQAPIVVYKLAQCLAYQSCEHNSWESSEAKSILDAISSHALDSFLRSCPEYENAPWGF